MAHKFAPQLDFYLVERSLSEKNQNGIIMPEVSQPKNRGVVCACGPGSHQFGTFVPTDSSLIGKKIVFNGAIAIEGDYLLVRHADVVAVVV